MDLNFLRTLQSMAKIEKDPNFQSKKYVVVKTMDQKVDPGEVPVVLKHPDQVIVVASPTGPQPPSSIGRYRFDQLSVALIWASLISRYGLKGCSILIYPGLYIDPTVALGQLNICQLTWIKGFSLEIVGIENVRILSRYKLSALFVPARITFTMKNVLIYERPTIDYDTAPIASVTILVYQAQVSLTDVRIHSSVKEPWATMEGLETVKAVDCTFLGYKSPFSVKKSKVHIESCRWVEIDGVGTVEIGGVLFMKDSIISGNGHIANLGQATLQGCQFVFGPNYPHQGIQIMSGGQLDMCNCFLSGCQVAVAVRDSHSKAVVKRCNITDCAFFLSAYLNASVSVTDCTLEVDNFVALKRNVSGKVQFARNVLRPRPSEVSQHYPALLYLVSKWPETAILYSDSVSKLEVVDHDYESTHVEYFEDEELISHSIGATRKSREAYAAKVTKDCEAVNWEAPTFSRNKWKNCVHCRKLPRDAPEAKFMYCSRCRKVCYCSKECQEANWKDHKLLCKKE